MNLSQLYYFKKLAELQHYTKAAKELFITQPALSDSMASLEKELAVQLFSREGRKVRLTSTGRDFYFYVCSALNELDSGIAMIREQSGTLSGTLNIGCIPTLLSSFLPDALQGYKSEKNRNVRIKIHNGHSGPIVQKLLSEDYDLGFCSKISEHEDELAFVPILYQEYVVVVRNGHHLSALSSISLEELRPYEILSYRKSIPIGADIAPYLEKFHLNTQMEFDDEISIGGIISTTNSYLPHAVWHRIFHRQSKSLEPRWNRSVLPA